MSKPIFLSKAVVIKAAKKAYLEGRLSAQGPTPECSYRDCSGHPCVIGAAMDNSTAKRLDSNSYKSIGALIRLGRVETDDAPFLVRLQRAHDSWAEGVSDSENDTRILLGLDPA